MKPSLVLVALLLAAMVPTASGAFTTQVYTGNESDGAIVRSVSASEPANVLQTTTYTISAGVTMTVTGTGPLVIFASESITIDGTLIADGNGNPSGALGSAGTNGIGIGGSGATAASGAGGGQRQSAAVPRQLASMILGSVAEANSFYKGAGGGGGQTGSALQVFGGGGGAGGACANGGAGGAGGANTGIAGTGGGSTSNGGGGAILLIAPIITLGPSSTISVDGRDGSSATGSSPNNSSGQGGSSAGVISFITRTLVEASGSTLSARGGNGGNGGGSGGAGAAGGAGGAAGCNAGANGGSPTNGGGGGGGGAGGQIIRHVDSLMEWRATWSSSPTYSPGATVLHNGLSYVAITTHTNQQPDTNPDDWTLMGNSGFTAITTTASEPAGVNCADGGQKVSHGLDNGDGGGTARDGTLQAGEVDSIAYTCNGAPGATGATGPQGIQGDAGPIGITWLGQWSDATTYAERDAVHYAGSAWYALQANTNSPPAPGSLDWDFIANADGNVVVPANMNVESELANTWVPVVLWALALWVCLRRAKGAAAFGALLGLLNELVEPMPGSFPGYALLFILLLSLEAIVGDRLWSRWLKRGEPSQGEDT